MNIKWGKRLREKYVKNQQQKLVLNFVLVLVNNPNWPIHARNSFENKMLLIKKPSDNSFIFSFEPSPYLMFKGIQKERGLKLVSYLSLWCKTLFKKNFQWSITFDNSESTFKTSYWFQFYIYPFEFGKCGKEGKKSHLNILGIRWSSQATWKQHSKWYITIYIYIIYIYIFIYIYIWCKC